MPLDSNKHGDAERSSLHMIYPPRSRFAYLQFPDSKQRLQSPSTSRTWLHGLFIHRHRCGRGTMVALSDVSELLLEVDILAL